MTTDRMGYSVAEAARSLGISPCLVREQCRTGRLRHVCIGQRIIIPRAALVELIGEPEEDGVAPESP